MKKAVSLILAATLAAGMMAGCGKSETGGQGSTVEESAGTAAASSAENDSKEAPMLAEQAAAGTIPALEERLPDADSVMVEPDVISIGTYGGSITSQTTDQGHWTWGPWTEESMFRFKQDGSGQVEANVCKNYYSNDDASVWTIELRREMKWSDGEPFTTDDVLFYYDHCSVPALNEDRTAVATDADGYYPAYTSKPYNCYQVTKDGKNYWAKFDKVDDYTFTVTFAAPKPNFPEAVAVDNKWMFLPKHFYINYVARKDGVSDDASFPLITEEQALANANKDFQKTWTDYSTMGKDIGYYNWDYAIVPQIRSFIAKKDNWNTVGEVYELVRNPYFWKTDSEGHQLPYLDSLRFEIVNDADQIVLKQTAGELDISAIESQNDYSTIATAVQTTHTIVPWQLPDWVAGPSIALCQTVKDLDKRALFQDVRFRQALSLAVDRNLLNITLFNGQSAPAQASPPENVLGHDDEWSSEYTDYDVDKANSLLDEITEPWDKKEGTYRKLKGTGKDVEIILSILDPTTVEGDYLPLLQTAYKAVGVKLSEKVDSNVAQSILTNDVEAKFEYAAVTSPAIRPDSVVPMRNFSCWYGAYGKWYEDGKSTANGGIEPDGDMLELINLYDTMKSASGPDREKAVSDCIDKIYGLHKKNIWLVGYLKALPRNWVVNNNVENFPSNLVWADEYRFASMIRPEQLYLDSISK